MIWAQTIYGTLELITLLIILETLQRRRELGYQPLNLPKEPRPLMPRSPQGDRTVKWIAFATVVVNFAISVVLFVQFRSGTPDMQFVERASWIDVRGISWFGRVHIEYLLGIDGLSVVMVLLTALISCVAVISSWTISKSLKGYFALLLLLDTGMMGVFVALDFFLFYVFWEVMLLPMYFLIGIWGGPRREYAAIRTRC